MKAKLGGERNWEEVPGHVSRLEVQGGWLYRYAGSEHMTFVASHPYELRGRLAREVRSFLEHTAQLRAGDVPPYEGAQLILDMIR